MTIPELSREGYLPPGRHECTVEDIYRCFGYNDIRKGLVEALERYISRLRDGGISGWMIVNGSFVTSKEFPQDVDVIVAVEPPQIHDVTLFARDYVREQFGLHVFVCHVNYSSTDGLSESGELMAKLFSMVRGNAGVEKGILRLTL